MRHYKTDWWSEREPARDDDEPFSDDEPLATQLGLIIDAELAGRVAVMNPFGAVVMQNKRTMALLWEAIDRFSPASQAAIRAFVPYTARLESLVPSTLAARADWVLKSDYGCEGAEVIIGADVDDATWADALAPRAPWPLDRAALTSRPVATPTAAAPTSASTSSAARRPASSAAYIAARPTITRRRWRRWWNVR